MNAVESYPASTSFNSMLDYATTAAAVTEHMKNDFQNAIRRNLHNWARWRTALNDRLVEAVMSGTHPLQTADDVEPIGLFLQRDAPDPDHSTTNPCTLLTFSAAPNSSTPLPSAEFYKFGIPRARLDPQRLYVSPPSSATASSDEDTSPHTAVANGRFVETSKSSRKQTGSWQSTSSSPAAAGSTSSRHISLSDDVFKYHSTVVDEGDDDDDLTFDYFNYTDDKASSCLQKQNPNSTKQRLHPSAAARSTVPSLSDGVISSSDHTASGLHQASPSSAAAIKSEQRRKMYQQQQQQQHTKQSTQIGQSAAGFGVVFGGPLGRQRIVTARRDDKLYGHHNAWHLDELPSWTSRV